MSEPVTEERTPVLDIPNYGGVAFDALMDALAPEAGTEAGSGEGAAPGAAGTPAPVVADGGAGTTGAGAVPAGQPAAGGDAPAGVEGGDSGGAADGAPAGDAATGQEPARAETPVPDLSPIVNQLGTISTTIEENVSKAYQAQAFEQVRTEHKQYFDALEKHPRLLVGQQVPAIGKEGMETLKDSKDAAEWQEAVRSILVQEIKAKAQEQMDGAKDYLETIHAAVDLFKTNTDLIPGTKGFDRELADQFATMAKPYEVRVDGKLHGYSIPVQPLVENLRAQLATRRAAAAPAATPPAAAPAETRPPAVEPPQAAIPSKAGSSSDKEDFSTLFGTIGLPNFQI